MSSCCDKLLAYATCIDDERCNSHCNASIVVDNTNCIVSDGSVLMLSENFNLQKMRQTRLAIDVAM